MPKTIHRHTQRPTTIQLMLAINEECLATRGPIPLSLVSNFVVTGIPLSVVFNPHRNRLRLRRGRRRYSVAFFSRSYLESWRRSEMVEAQRREERKREKKQRNEKKNEKSVATTVEEKEEAEPFKDWGGRKGS